MANSLVSIKIPASLLKELKDLSKKDHFLDVSEAIRSIVRNNWIKEKENIQEQVRKLRKEITENINQKKQEEILLELQEIRDNILRRR